MKNLGFLIPYYQKKKKERVGLEEERIKYWLSQGAQPTTRVARILGENKMMEMPAKGNNPQKAIPKKDRKKDGEEAKSDAPKAEEKKADAPKAEEKKADAPKAKEKKTDAPKAEEKKTDAPKAEEKK